MVVLFRGADPNLIHFGMMHSLLFSFGPTALLTLTNLIPLTHFVNGGPLGSDLWDLETTSSPVSNVAPPGDLWSTDSSTDSDLFAWPGSSDFTSEYDDDLLLAANPSCHAGADLTQFEPYSKLRARESCPAGKPTPPLALPTLEQLGNPDDGSGSVGLEDLNKDFRIIPAPQTGTQEDDDPDPTCPSDKTYGSKVPVCDSGKLTDSHKLAEFAYTTLYNVQLCLSHHAALASVSNNK